METFMVAALSYVNFQGTYPSCRIACIENIDLNDWEQVLGEYTGELNHHFALKNDGARVVRQVIWLGLDSPAL